MPIKPGKGCCLIRVLFYTTLTLHSLNLTQSHSPSYRLAYDDIDFIMRDELRDRCTLVDNSITAQCDRKPIQDTETAEQAWHLILESYPINGNNNSDKKKATL